MLKTVLAALTVGTVTALALTGCTSRSEAAASAAATGFPAHAVVGVALPDKTSENFAIAGKLFTDGLRRAGFTPDVQYAPATNTVAEQQNQIESMITNGAKVIIIGAKDGSQLSTQVADATAAGAVVIAYDRLILNTPNVDYYVAYDNERVGELQGQALLDGMKAKYPNNTSYNIELFAGSPDDNNAGVFFRGAMKVLQPKIDDGTLRVVSGQTDFKQVTTQGWLAQNAQSRMDTLLAGFYATTELDGVLSPNDTLARAILQSISTAGKPYPIVTGQDSEADSVKSIMAGIQYSTINKDTRKLVAEAIKMVGELQRGEKVDVNDPGSYDNGAKTVPTFLLPPQLVTRANAAQSYRGDPALEPLTRG
ncbi:substrate-binding domain-containing protein [Lysinimonas soli]|uniref:Substrate-binding domain-containing protein n=1 Tax=Lysinimonas soli TaxID=1074233 RepID=A0ABW0NSA5_9MICO